MYNPYQQMQQGFGQPQNFSTTYSQMPQQALQQFANPGYNYFQAMPQMQAANLGSLPQMQYQQQQPGSMFPSVTQAHTVQPAMSLHHQMGMSMQQAAASLPSAAAGLSSVNSVAANAHGMSGLSRLTNDSASGADDHNHAIAAAALQAVVGGRDLSNLGGHHHHSSSHGHGNDSHGHGNVRGGGGGGGADRHHATKAEQHASSDRHASTSSSARSRPKKDKPKKPSVFSRPCRISPELQNVVGGDMMTRSEVVSRMWKYVREQNLLDPKQKQFAVCDDKLEKVIGEKRFRVFGMMKYLKLHIFDPAGQGAGAAALAAAAAVAAATAAATAEKKVSIGGEQPQLHHIGNNGDLGGVGVNPLGNGGLQQFAPPIDQSSPSGGGGGGGAMHHSHSQHDLNAGGVGGGNSAAVDLVGGGGGGGGVGNVSVADDGSSPNDALGQWNDEGEQQDEEEDE